MDASVISAISGFGGILVTSVVGVIVAKVNNKKDLTINDRQLLSKDQQQFYDMVMNQVRLLQDRADNLETEVGHWKAEALQLRTENTALNDKLSHLEQTMGG